MPSYNVTIPEQCIEVVADDEDDARDTALFQAEATVELDDDEEAG